MFSLKSHRPQHVLLPLYFWSASPLSLYMAMVYEIVFSAQDSVGADIHSPTSPWTQRYVFVKVKSPSPNTYGRTSSFWAKQSRTTVLLVPTPVPFSTSQPSIYGILVMRQCHISLFAVPRCIAQISGTVVLAFLPPTCLALGWLLGLFYEARTKSSEGLWVVRLPISTPLPCHIIFLSPADIFINSLHSHHYPVDSLDW